MFGEMETVICNHDQCTKPLWAGITSLLLLGTTIAAATPVAADESNQAGVMTFSLQTVEENRSPFVTVHSSSGMRWDRVSTEQHKINVEAHTDTEQLGVVYSTGLYPGHCLTDTCNTHPAIWTAEPDHPISGIELDVSLSETIMLTKETGEFHSPAAWLGEHAIAECNAYLGEDGPVSDFTIPVKFPFSLTLDTENLGSLRRTSTIDFAIKCEGFEQGVSKLKVTAEIETAGVGAAGSEEGALNPPEDDNYFEQDDPLAAPEEDVELDLGSLIPFPFPPVTPPAPEVPETPVEPEVNPSLGELPDDLVSNDDGVGPDPGPDPHPGSIVLLPPKPPVDPKVNPDLGPMPGGLNSDKSPFDADKKEKAEQQAIGDALKKKQEAKRKEEKKKSKALLDAQREKQNAKKKRKAEKKALRKALKKKAKEKGVAKRIDPKPTKKKKVSAKRTNTKKPVKAKRNATVKPKPKKVATKTSGNMKKKKKIKVAPTAKKKWAQKPSKAARKKRIN